MPGGEFDWGGRLRKGIGGAQRFPQNGRKPFEELGSERRETVRSLSGVGVGYLRGAVLSTRGPGWTDRWWTGWLAKAMAG